MTPGPTPSPTPSPTSSPSARLSSVRRYPLKSGRGESLDAAVVEPWGLAGDRRWMVVDAAGEAVTAREVNHLVLVTPRLTERGLRLEAPGRPVLDVDRPTSGRRRRVAVFGSWMHAPVAEEASAWISEVVGEPADLVWLEDPTQRGVDLRYGEEADRVSFADGYPLLLASETSLAALDDEVLARAQDGREPLPMARFRPNLVVTGAPAWAEDDWRRVRVGEVTFRAVKGCARCVITTVDPDSGQREKEPLATLARVRRFDSGTWFAINLVPETAGGTLHVGDEVEVLEAVVPGGGPLRRTS